MPAPLRLRAEVRAIAAGATHTMAVTTEGKVLTWGSNHHGQLGRPDLAYAALPMTVAFPEAIQSVAAGMHFSLALAESGNVYAWGWNSHGQLGLNDSADRGVPARVPGLERVRSIAAGETHAAALTARALIGWGSNATGQIGTAERMQRRPTPFFSLA
jgi:alpha-tubulin suppressor-like RCC1 family protein